MTRFYLKGKTLHLPHPWITIFIVPAKIAITFKFKLNQLLARDQWVESGKCNPFWSPWLTLPVIESRSIKSYYFNCETDYWSSIEQGLLVISKYALELLVRDLAITVNISLPGEKEIKGGGQHDNWGGREEYSLNTITAVRMWSSKNEIREEIIMSLAAALGKRRNVSRSKRKRRLRLKNLPEHLVNSFFCWVLV